MIFGSLDSYCDVGKTVVGRAVANREFVKALLRYDPFEEYHFFLGDSFDHERFRDFHAFVREDRVLEGKVKLFYRHQLPQMISKETYHVFHQSDFITHTSSLANLRSRWACTCFPITGITHSLSYQRLMPAYLDLLMNQNVMACDAIVGTSRCGIEALKKIFGQLERRYKELYALDTAFKGTYHHIPLGVDTDFFAPRPKRQAREKLRLPREGRVLLSVARFSSASKMDLFPLVRSFKDMVEGEKEMPLYLVLAGASEGSGYLKALEKLCNAMGLGERVIFLPDFKEADKPFLYGAADVFISMSDNLQETFGLTVLEAMSCARPVVVSDFNGYKELVIDGVEGFKVPTLWAPASEHISETVPVAFESIYHLHLAQSISFDTGSLKGAIWKLIGNRDLCRDMGNRGRQKCVSEYAWKRVVKRYMALWNELGRLAGKTEGVGAKGHSLYELDFFQAFSHYPSEILDGSKRVEITAPGKEVYQRRRGYWAYEELTGLLELSLVRTILFWAQRKDHVGEVVEAIGERNGEKAAIIYYHMMWMIKHGLLTVT